MSKNNVGRDFMDTTESIAISPEEAADFEEFRRRKRIAELRSRLRGLEPTLLKRDASLSEIRALCEQAKRIECACVGVQPVYVRACRNLLKDCNVRVSGLVGGNSESALKTKLCEASFCLRSGAQEIEFMPCVSALINGNFSYFRREIRKIVRRARGKTVKVRLDVDLLPRDKILRAAHLAADAGANYLSVRADEELILLLQQQLGAECAVKASGVESAEAFRNMSALGCVRVETERAGDIVRDMEEDINPVR